MKKITVALFVGCIFIQACGPSESDIANAIKMTEMANPTATTTVTPSPTTTDTPAPTDTPQPSPTPSPTPDFRVYNIDPRELLLTKEDLPSDAEYYLPNSTWISPHRNSEIISGWGVTEGQAYLAETGRVDGWVASYARGTKTVIAPEEMYDNVVLYKYQEGALLVINEYSFCMDPETGFTPLDSDVQIGDVMRVCIDKEMQSNGRNRVWLRVEFVYRNVYHAVVGWGWEEEVTADYVLDVASELLSKLEGQTLSDQVTFEP